MPPSSGSLLRAGFDAMGTGIGNSYSVSKVATGCLDLLGLAEIEPRKHLAVKATCSQSEHVTRLAGNEGGTNVMALSSGLWPDAHADMIRALAPRTVKGNSARTLK